MKRNHRQNGNSAQSINIWPIGKILLRYVHRNLLSERRIQSKASPIKKGSAWDPDCRTNLINPFLGFDIVNSIRDGVIMGGAVVDSDFVLVAIIPRKRMFHPGLSFRSGYSHARERRGFLCGYQYWRCHTGLRNQIIKLQCSHQIRIPDHSPVIHRDIFDLSGNRLSGSVVLQSYQDVTCSAW